MPRTGAGSAGSAGSAVAPVAPVARDAATGSGVDAPIDAPVVVPVVTAEERAMVATWFAKLNGTEPLVIKGVDVEPFRKTHRDHRVDDGTQIAYAVPPKEGKRTFVLTKLGLGAGKRIVDARVFMTFDEKNQLVGISY